MLAVPPDDFAVVHALFPAQIVGKLIHLVEAHDGGDGCAQFVAGLGKEQAARLVHGFQFSRARCHLASQVAIGVVQLAGPDQRGGDRRDRQKHCERDRVAAYPMQICTGLNYLALFIARDGMHHC